MEFRRNQKVEWNTFGFELYRPYGPPYIQVSVLQLTSILNTDVVINLHIPACLACRWSKFLEIMFSVSHVYEFSFLGMYFKEHVLCSYS